MSSGITGTLPPQYRVLIGNHLFMRVLPYASPFKYYTIVSLGVKCHVSLPISFSDSCGVQGSFHFYMRVKIHLFISVIKKKKQYFKI